MRGRKINQNKSHCKQKKKKVVSTNLQFQSLFLLTPINCNTVFFVLIIIIQNQSLSWKKVLSAYHNEQLLLGGKKHSTYVFL